MIKNIINFSNHDYCQSDDNPLKISAFYALFRILILNFAKNIKNI